MYVDYFSLAALVDEFMDVLVGGKIQDAIDTDHTGIGLEIYNHRQRHYLYMSADQRTPRVHIFPEKLRRGVQKPTQLGLMFRRYVEGGRVLHVSQPEWERVIQIDVEGPEGDVVIVIEPMERRGNVLLLRDGVILDCIRRVGPEENRYRLSLPNHEYQLPPPQTGKLDPTQITLADLEGIFEQNTDRKQKTHRLLTSRFLGFSPLVAKEIVHRASGDQNQRATEANPEMLLTALHEVVLPLKNHEWQPGVIGDNDTIEAFSVYPLQSMNGWRPVESVSVAMSAYFGAPVGEEAYDAAKVPVREAITEAMAKLNAKLNSLRRSLKDETERDELRQSGELILAYQYTLQEGQTSLEAQYDPEAEPLNIKLNPELTPIENAQRYFDRYERAKRALDDVPRLIKGTQNELDYVRQLNADLEFASSWPDIDDVQQALQSRGYWRGKRVGRVGGGRSAPIRLVTEDGFVLWVGRNSRQNDIVTFDKGKAEDLWLHARDVPGAHLVIKNDGRRIQDELIEKAAAIAAYYSSNRSEGAVIVDVTRCKYVKKIRGAGSGMVTYRNEVTRTVKPLSEEAFDGINRTS